MPEEDNVFYSYCTFSLGKLLSHLASKSFEDHLYFKLIMMKFLIIIFLFVYASQSQEQPFAAINDFGMNKPHLLFQLG